MWYKIHDTVTWSCAVEMLWVVKEIVTIHQTIVVKVSNIPVSQFVPVNPATQEQLYASILFSHVAPFKHGLELHSSIPEIIQL